MHKDNLISIIIVNWNGKKWLKKCLDSLNLQTYKNFEIILVDNNSADDSVLFIQTHYPSVKLVLSPINVGFAGGNNLGVKEARGEFILFLNNDTWVKKDFLEGLFDELTIQGLDVIGPYEAHYTTKSSARPYHSMVDPLGHAIYVIGHETRSFFLTGVCLLFKKDVYLQTRGLDSNFFMYCEEVDWFWRLSLLKKKFSYTNRVQVYHAVSGSSGDGIKYKTFLWRNQNTLQMLIKNYRWYNLLWALPLYFLQNVIEIIVFLLLLKPKIAGSYLEGWYFNLKNLKKIMAKRAWVQHNRIVSDAQIIKIMYRGPGKIHHLISYLKK